MYTIGYDIGTRFIKICLVKDGEIAAFEITEPGRDIAKAINTAYKSVLDKAGIYSFRIRNSGATGFGSAFVNKTKCKIDLSRCLARGVYGADSSVKTAVDVGGLFIHISQIGNKGKLIETIENERCAAGSGRFIETISRAIELPFSMISEEISKSTNPCHITNNCSVFAESEVISRVNQGVDRADIICGLLYSLVSKIETMLGMISDEGCIALTGGVSEIEGFRKILKERIKRDIVTLPVNRQIVSAYGAALIASENK